MNHTSRHPLPKQVHRIHLWNSISNQIPSNKCQAFRFTGNVHHHVLLLNMHLHDLHEPWLTQLFDLKASRSAPHRTTNQWWFPHWSQTYPCTVADWNRAKSPSVLDKSRCYSPMVIYQRKTETVNTAKMKRQQQSITFQTSQLNEGRRQSAAPKFIMYATIVSSLCHSRRALHL